MPLSTIFQLNMWRSVLFVEETVAGSDVESWYWYTVLFLTLRYVHELSIRRLLLVYARLLQKGDAKM
jgi:hypothetical protein